MYIERKLHLAENLDYEDLDQRQLWDDEAFRSFGDIDPGIMVAYLDHSCDEWVIGGKDEVKALIEDLQLMLEQM